MDPSSPKFDAGPPYVDKHSAALVGITLVVSNRIGWLHYNDVSDRAVRATCPEI